MYSIVREFQAPFGVTHAIRGRFIPSSTALGVIFARKNSLDFNVVRANSDVARLELLQSTPLGANIVSMDVMRRANTPVDLLCVGFSHMRVAIMAWDHDTRDWTTEQTIDLGTQLGVKLCSPSTIMRSLDPSDYGRPLLRGKVGDHADPVIRTDPSGRCFAVHAKGQNTMYIVPVRSEEDSTRIDARVVNRDEVFIIDLPTEYEASNVKDFAFLQGSFEPNILVLHEPKRTWSGRAAIQRNTCCLLNLSIDIRSRRHSKTWTMDQLPYDSQRILPVPESAGGGALLLSTSVLIQVRHGACVAGLSLNNFGDAYASEMKSRYDTITQSDTVVECDAAHCRFLDYEERLPDATSPTQSIALMSLKGGELYFLSLAVGSRNLLVMKRAGSTVIASEIVPINDRFFVLASRLSDSLLVEYQRSPDVGRNTSQSENSEKKHETKDGDLAEKPKSKKQRKRRRTAEEEAEYEMIYGVKPPDESSDEESVDESGKPRSALELEEKDEGTRGVYDDDDELGWVFNSGSESDSGSGKASGSGGGTWALKVKDTITCFGPGADMAIGSSPDDITNTKLDMVIAGGYAKNGCLAVIHQSIRATIRTEFEVSGCKGVWALLDPSVTLSEKRERDARNALAKRRNSERRARNTKKLAARKRFVDEEMEKFLKEKVEQGTPEEAKINNVVDPSSVTLDVKSSESDADDTKLPAASDHEGNDAKAALDGLNSESEITKSQDQNNLKPEEPPAKKVKLNEEKLKDESANGTTPAPQNDAPQVPDEVKLQLEQQAEESYPLEEEEALEENISEDNNLHAYMLLSTESTTTALRTGAEIEELMGNAIGFSTNERTIAAGNIFGNHAIVQVTPSVVKILSNGKVQCQYNVLEGGNRIRYAHISDPFILLILKEGSIRVLAARAVESKEDYEVPQSKGSVDVQEDLFDEYGMAVVPDESITRMQENSHDIENKDKFKDSSSAEKKSMQSTIILRDFRIDVEYPIDREEQQPDISTACLYKGPLAAELAKDGILNTKQPQSLDEKPENTNGTKQPDVLGALSSAANGEKSPKAEENGQMEDEDRMLYGDEKDDEEDMMLYGAADDDNKVEAGANGTSGDANMKDQELYGSNNTEAGRAAQGQAVNMPSERGVMAISNVLQTEENEGENHLLILCTTDGALKVLSSALGWQVVLECPTFFAAPRLVTDSPLREEDKLSQNYPTASPDLEIRNIAMMELAGSALLSGLSTPFLVAISKTGLPMIYRAYLSVKSHSTQERRSRLSFHRMISRDRTASLLARSVRNTQRGARTSLTKENDLKETQAPIHHFRNIAGRSGIVLGGQCPIFLFAERGYPRIHALSHSNSSEESISKEEYDLGQAMISFTEFHNVKCPRGFVSVGKDGAVRIGELPPPSAINYDAPAPMKKIALRCTPHKVAYHAGSATYGVLASMPTLTTREERLLRILQSLEKHDKRHYQHTAAQAEAETGDDRADRGPPLFEELHELRVYRPDTWDLIKSHKLQTGEVGLAIANMKVDVYKQKTANSGVDIPSSKKGDDGNESTFAASSKMRPKDMLVVGTGYLNGEDASSRGRLLMFEVSRQEVYTDGGGVYTAFQLQLIAEKELFSPVTAVASMEGYVIAGVGPQVSVYKLVGDEIIHLSFAFGQLYCTSLASIKQYVVAADMCKSVSFMYFRDRNNSVNFLGKDYEHVTSFATEFLLENENMSIVVSDGKGNLQLMNYVHASEPESRGGKRLLRNGGICFGSRINKFVRMRSPDSHADLQNGRAGTKAGIHSLLFATLDGGVGALVSSTEVQFLKMRELYNAVIEYNSIQRRAGVNPVEQTAFRPETASSVLLGQRMVDSRAVLDIFSVTLIEMRVIARRIGTDLEGLAQMVMDLDVVLSRF